MTGKTSTARCLVLMLLMSCQACAADALVSTPCDTDYAALKTEEMAVLDQGVSIYRRLARNELAETELTAAEIAALEGMQTILDSRHRPVDEVDLAILDDAMTRLVDPELWDRADDRQCSPDDETVSLFCALQFASEAVVGEYQHRRTAIQEVRFAIEDFTGGRDFEHRLMDFNNLPETSLDDVRQVLAMARDRVRDRLAEQAGCSGTR